MKNELEKELINQGLKIGDVLIMKRGTPILIADLDNKPKGVYITGNCRIIKDSVFLLFLTKESYTVSKVSKPLFTIS